MGHLYITTAPSNYKNFCFLSLSLNADQGPSQSFSAAADAVNHEGTLFLSHSLGFIEVKSHNFMS